MPSLRFHKASGQCYVVLNGKAIYCGSPTTPPPSSHYHQAIAEWLAAGQQLPADPATITIKELLARFWTYAEQYYRTLTDGRGKELEQFRLAFRPLKDLYADIAGSRLWPAGSEGRPAEDDRHRLVPAVRQQADQPHPASLQVGRQRRSHPRVGAPCAPGRPWPSEGTQ